MSILYRKSWKDIRHRWARSLFTIATIAAAVVGMGLFALPALMDRGMERQVERDRLHDIEVYLQDLELSEADLAALEALPGVVALEARTIYATQVRIGDRREDVLLVGVRDFGAQAVNIVSLATGEAPGDGEALSDTQNDRSGRLDSGRVSTVEVEDNAGTLHRLALTGTGRTMQFSQVAIDDALVLYAPQQTVNAISGTRGVDTLDVRVDDPEQGAEVASAIRAWLAERYPEVVFPDLADVRPAGTWPGQDVFNNFSTLFYVGALLAFISAVALISNTMTTMVAEQRREIAIMKAIGGGRRQVAFSFLRTAGLLSFAGSALGAVAGIPFANVVTRFVGSEFAGVTPAWGVAWPVVVLSLVAGVIGTTLAALPALVRAARSPVHQGLTVSLAGSGGNATRLLRLVPLPSVASIGLRNIARRKTRALGTMIQVGLAVGVALGFLALGVTVGRLTADTWDTLRWDVIVGQSSNVAFDEEAGEILAGVDGVRSAEPLLYNNLKVGDTQYETWGIRPQADLYSPSIVAGRWLEAADGEARAPVVVVGRAFAATWDLDVGDQFTAESANGQAELTVVGIDSTLMNNGTNIFVPFESFQDILGRDDTNAYWLTATAPDEAAIDRMAASAEDALANAGYPASTEIRYIEKEANLASNRTLVRVLAVMGIPIVAIGLIGLVNMMTMNVIERTREVGILRCIGAGHRDITRIFRAEALAVAAVGWLFAVPLGWLIGKSLVEIVAALFDFGDIPYYFPAWYPPIALVLTLALAWIVVIPPLRRASRLHPGDALRYE